MKKIFAIDAISFGVRSTIGHIRLYSFIIFLGSAVIGLIIGIISLLNQGLINTLISLPMFQTFQQCIGSRCFMVAYESGLPIMSLVYSNIISLSVSFLLSMFFVITFNCGLKRVALDIYDNDTSEMSRIFAAYRSTLKAIMGALLYWCLVLAGFLFFVVPGFIALLRFGFFSFYIIDKNAGVVESFRMSYYATSDYAWEVFAFWVILKMITSFCFFSWIGMVLICPLSTLAYTYVYRQLCSASSEKIEFFKASV